jgi:protein-S-isoprenylcysteine O-methyltransferase
VTNLLNSPGLLLRLPQYMGDLYGLSELVLLVSRRSRGRGRSEDQGSLLMLWLVIIGSIVAANFTAAFDRDSDSPLLAWLVPLGIVLFVFGLALRWYAIVYLGRYFTVDVAIAADHRVVDSGPYRLIRHPSYTGALLCFLGLGICFRNWLALAWAFIPPTLMLLWRIRIEEGALTRALGETYVNYSARTRRLIPFVY